MADLKWKAALNGRRRSYEAPPYSVVFDGLAWRAYCNGALLADEKGRTSSPIPDPPKRTCAKHHASIVREAGIKVRAQ